MTNEHLVVLDAGELPTKPEPRLVGRRVITATPSPYDVPQAVLTYENEREGTYIVELKYIDSGEPEEVRSFGEALDVCTGKNSKRIYRFVVHHDVSTMTKGGTLQLIRGAVETLINADPRKDNYRLIGTAFTAHGDRLIDLPAEKTASQQK